MIEHLRKVMPARLRRSIFRFVDRHVPMRFRVPFKYYSLRLQGALEDEMGLLKKIVPPNKVAVDIGAHQGVYSFQLATLCDRVESFEPNADCVSILRAWNSSRVNVHELALSSAPGNAELSIPMDGSWLATLRDVGGVCVKRPVEVQTLDAFKISPVGFIKIDVEGHETDVLQGALETIRRERPILLIEIEQRHRTNGVDEVFRLMSSEGYRGSFLRGGKLRPIESFSVELDQTAILEGKVKGKYINNFLFIPVGHALLLDKSIWADSF